MVAGHPDDPPRGRLTRSAPPPDRLLQDWCRPLQQACQLEADRGFTNLQGRRETFAGFVGRNLGDPAPTLNPVEQGVLEPLHRRFRHYESLDVPERRRLVAALRQELHQLERQRRPARPAAPPRLRLMDDASAHESGRRGQVSATTPLGEVAGIGPRTATRLAALGLLLVRDLLAHYPREYLDYAHLVRIEALEAGRTATIVATVRRCHAFASSRNPNLSVLELHLEDVTGRVRVSRFSIGHRSRSPAWLKSLQRQYPLGSTVVVSGLVKDGRHGPSFREPLIEVLDAPGATVRSDKIGRLVPVYGLTEGLTADRMRRALQSVLDQVEPCRDPLDPHLRSELQLLPRQEAIEQIHRPRSRQRLQAARRRLVFDEFLLLQLSLGQRRLRMRRGSAPVLASPSSRRDLVSLFLGILPFLFTAAQERVLVEIRRDMARPQPMARLLQGDVGSGKTVVAVAALLAAVEAGCQGALLVPTEVLADQHFRRLAEWMPQLHVTVDRLSGSTPARKRRELLRDLANGQLHILVGTHALLEDPVQFQRLGLVVVDEQHRFGVHQRNRLLAKGLQPHLLTMTATPIPRTLALSIHGDLEISQIDELPPGRTPVQTRMLRAGERSVAHQLIREQVARGQRAYVVLPLVEESEKLDLRSAVEMHEQLSQQVFADLEVGLLHGRLSSEEKQKAIHAFATGTTQVLVSTTVVEVGVDVPEASVMVIEHAERFGLAQLHQLRGRVGRGAAVSHCLLIHDSRQATASERLELLVRSSDGFEIAEMDLRLRGPGQVLGTRQSGLPDFALASLRDDGEVLELSREVAVGILQRDPELEHQSGLRQALAEQRLRLEARLN